MESSHAVSIQSLQEHFGDLEQQRESSTLGMWVFLITEIMFFGGLFTAYLVYRSAYPTAWSEGSQGMDFYVGTINTAVLICSSLTMALAVHASQLANRKIMVALLIVTLLFGLAFLGLKGYEYYGHYLEHRAPGISWMPEPHWLDPRHVQMFYVLYFFMTGFHALHMVVGVGLVTWIAILGWKGVFTPEYHNPVENVGLYWHFVDIIWIFLYPLLYLITHKHV